MRPNTQDSAFQRLWLSAKRFRRALSRSLRSVRSLIWRREIIGFAGRLTISAVLIGISGPQLIKVFTRASPFSPGAVVDIRIDCDAQLSVHNDFEVDNDGYAKGSVLVKWLGLPNGCKKLHISGPSNIQRISVGPRDQKLNDPALTVRNFSAEVDLQSYGYNGLLITVEPFEFVQPITFVRSVTQTLVRSYYHPEQKPGESGEDLIKRIKMLAPELSSRILLPYRYGLTEALVTGVQTEAMSNGTSRIQYTGNGIIMLEDREHAESKDQIILIYGTLLATGLAMLAEFACKIAEAAATDHP